jgi:hypothetical protein
LKIYQFKKFFLVVLYGTVVDLDQLGCVRWERFKA